MVSYPPACLAAAAAHALARHPEEACGVVLEDCGGALRFRPIANVADRPRSAYLFDPREQLEVWSGPDRVVAIVHSHCDAGAFFSQQDREDAMIGPREGPLFPGVEYLVLSVWGPTPRIDEVRAWGWDGAGWAERPVGPLHSPAGKLNGRP